MKRVVTLDILRGIAILVVILTHVFIYVVEYDIFDLNNGGSILVIIVLAPFIFLGKWRSFFLMISAASQLYSMHKGLERKNNSFVVLMKQIFNAFLLLGVAYLFKIFLLPNAALYDCIFTGVWDISAEIPIIQVSDTLESIALCRIVIALIYYVMTLGRGMKKSYRNIIIFGALCLISIAITPVIVRWVYATTGLHPFSIRYTASVSTWKERFKRVFLANVVGWNQPLFPFVSFAFGGAIYGIIFTKKSFPKKKFLRTAFYISLGLLILGICLIPFSEDIRADIWDPIYSPWITFINMGMQSMCFLLAMKAIEFKSNNVKKIRRWRFFRRFGILSLSIYCMELIELIPRWITSQIFNVDLVTGRTANLGILLVLVILTLGFWAGIVRLWEFARFYGSLEVSLQFINGSLFWKKPNFKDPLHSQSILYNVEPISLLEQDSQNNRTS